MINFLIFLLSTIGLTNIIVHGKILDNLKIRPFLKEKLPEKFYELFECYECTGFWAGLIMGYFLVSHDLFIFVPCAFAGSLISQFYTEIIFMIRSKTDFVVEESDES